MKFWSTLALTSAMAALFVSSGVGHADEHDITANDVRAYFEQLQQELTEIVQTGEVHRLPELTERHVADGASFKFSGETIHEDDRKVFVVVDLEKEDLLRLRHLAAMAMEGVAAIQDYSLEIEVEDVISHGPGAATVRTRWMDSGTIDPAAMEGGAERAPEEATLSFERSFRCNHVVVRGDEQLMVGLTNCQGQARL